MKRQWRIVLLLMVALPLLLAATGDIRRVPMRDQPLAPSGNHTVIVLGDSLATDTPFQNFPPHGMAVILGRLFAEDADYTATTGSDLGPTTSTTGGSWDLANATWTQGTETLTLTTVADTFGVGTWKARGRYWPATSPNGIDISANPTDRYLLQFDLDTSAFNTNIGPPAAANGYTVANVDYFLLRIEADSCAPDDYLIAATDGYGGFVNYAVAFPDAPTSTHYIVLDPNLWTVGGDDYSGASGFGDSTCRIELWFEAYSAVSAVEKIVTVTNIDLTRLTKSVRVIRWGDGGQVIGGVDEDDYPAAKSAFLTGKTNPIDAAVLVVGRNDYDGQSGTDSGGASTVTSYFADLAALKSTMAADGVAPVVKVVPLSSKGIPDATAWAPTNAASDTGPIAWRAFQIAERNWLRQNGWDFVDPLRWFTFSDEVLVTNVLLDGDDFPTGGASKTFPISISPTGQSTFVADVKLLPTKATTDTTGVNEYCINVRDLRDSVDLISSDSCTGATAFIADDHWLLSVDQNRYMTDPGGAKMHEIGLEVNSTGTPTSMAGELILAQVLFRSGWWNPENPFMWDDQHASNLGYYTMAEGAYKALTGRAEDGAR